MLFTYVKLSQMTQYLWYQPSMVTTLMSSKEGMYPLNADEEMNRHSGCGMKNMPAAAQKTPGNKLFALHIYSDSFKITGIESYLPCRDSTSRCKNRRRRYGRTLLCIYIDPVNHGVTCKCHEK